MSNETNLVLLQNDCMTQEDCSFSSLFELIAHENLEGFLFEYAGKNIDLQLQKNCLICDTPYNENQKVVECSCKCIFHKNCLLDTSIFQTSCPNCGKGFLKCDECSNSYPKFGGYTNYKNTIEDNYYSEAQKRLKIAVTNPSRTISDNRTKMPIVSKNSLETKSSSISSCENNGQPEISIFLFTFMQNSYSYIGQFNQNNKPHGYGRLYTLDNN